MRTATVALGQTNSVTGSLSYIDSLVTAAAAQGQFNIVVGAKILNDTMIGQLTSTYGYKISAVNNDIGNNVNYIITW